VVLGNNGYIWLSKSLSSSSSGSGGSSAAAWEAGSSSSSGGGSSSVDEVLAMKERHSGSHSSSEVRRAIARVRNAVVLLNRWGCSINSETIMKVVRSSVEGKGMGEPKYMLSSQGTVAIRRQLVLQEQGE